MTLASSCQQMCEDVGPRLQRAFELLARSLPPNWHDGDFHAGVRLASAGWPIVWVPRPDIVASLISADTDDQRNELLVQEASQILDDIDQVLDDIERTGPSMFVVMEREAVAAGRQNLWIACQTTVATILDGLVGVKTLLKPNIKKLPEAFDEDETAIVELRLALILQALPRAFVSFWPDRGDPIPTTFNRHATVHTPSVEQFTPQNALFGLLLTTSLLRELHEHGDGRISIGDILIRSGLDEDGHDGSVTTRVLTQAANTGVPNQ